MRKNWLKLLLVPGSVFFTSQSKDDDIQYAFPRFNYKKKENVQLSQRSILRSFNTEDFDGILNEVDRMIFQSMKEHNIPGVCISVHVHGIPIFDCGYGYSDIENATIMSHTTSMRIASISKFLTALIAMRLQQVGTLDIDSSLAELFSNNNLKFRYNNEEQEITTKQLLNHTSGIRHYQDAGASDSDSNEFYNNKKYESVYSGLDIFANDELKFVPGTDFSYTTFGYSLLGFVLENVSGKSFDELLIGMTNDLGLKNTHLDKPELIIPNRCRYYQQKDGKISNCPYVDNSSKWAGGGMVSTTEDIATLGDLVLFCAQSAAEDNYWSFDTISKMIEYNPITEHERKSKPCYYGLGLYANMPVKRKFGKEIQVRSFHHPGGAVGATTNLVIIPTKDAVYDDKPQGITVAMFCNLESGGKVTGLAHDIALKFMERVKKLETIKEDDYVIDLM